MAVIYAVCDIYMLLQLYVRFIFNMYTTPQKRFVISFGKCFQLIN